MLAWLKQKRKVRHNARELYGSIVTQARDEFFYDRLGVPDSPEGRLELIVLHLVLVLDRLQVAGNDAREAARALTEAFVIDMDDGLREMGTGDLAVPRKVRKAAAAVFDRHRDYMQSWRDADPMALDAALARHVGRLGAGVHVADLADYARAARDRLATQDLLNAGGAGAVFPRPSADGRRARVSP
ncbi:MAG: ubiquinol-cytochrome C chaperone family protein [Hyphomicrobiaceae bacterium]